MNSQQPYNQSSDEISLKDIILRVKEYLSYFWSKKFYILVPFVILVSLFIYQAKTTPWMYMGQTKFFLEGSGGASASGLGGILGQIGVGGKKSNPFQIIEVAESKIQVTDILFEKVGADSTFLANKVLEIYDLPTIWSEDNPDLADFSFKHDSIEAFTKLEKKALSKTIRRLVDNNNGNALMITSYEEEKGFYSILVKTINSDLSLAISEISYNKLKEYFEDKTRAQLKISRDLLREKSDSIKYLLDRKIADLANFRDRNKSLIYNIDQVQEIVLESEIAGLSSAYMEGLKSYEMADYKYSELKNNFMLIDRPMEPLPIIIANWKIEGLKGGILALLLSIGFLFVYKLYHDILNSET